MLDLTVPMVEVWFAGAKLGEYANDLEALKAASLHADSLPLIAESVEYELRRDTMKYIVHRRIVGPDAPALGPVLTISSTALTVTLDRPASGPTSIDRYELERYNGSAWVQIASGLSIFGATNQYADSSLTASTAYQYRCRAVDTTERASEYSYATGTTSAGATNSAPVWQTGWTLTIRQGDSVSVASRASDPEGDALTFSKVSGGTTSTTMLPSGVLTVGASVPVGDYTPVLLVSDGQLTDEITVPMTVTAAPTGNTFTIPQGTATYNASAVQPGDVIVIEGDVNGNRGPLKITNANGSASSRITIRNPTTKRINVGATATGGFIFELNNSSYVEIDGSYYSGETYGLNFTRPTSSSSVSSFVKFTGVVNHVTMRNFEIDGKTTSWGSGITPTGVSAQDKTQLRTSETWREDYTFENFYVHNLPGEGLYLGNNFSDGCIPSKNMIVQNGTVENVGRDGIQAKGWWSGTNRISGCTVSNVGRNTADPERGQRYGISVLSGKADVYNNTVLDVGESGIQMAVQSGPADGATYGSPPVTLTEFASALYNNVIARVGLRSDSLAATGNGITTYMSAGTLVEPLLQVYNNTIVDSEGAKISFHADISSSSIAQNNILLGTGSAVSIDAGTENNNLKIGSLSSVFVAPESDNYHLSGEQAVTAGLTSSSDIEGTSRAGTASKGAYEFA